MTCALCQDMSYFRAEIGQVLICLAIAATASCAAGDDIPTYSNDDESADFIGTWAGDPCNRNFNCSRGYDCVDAFPVIEGAEPFEKTCQPEHAVESIERLLETGVCDDCDLSYVVFKNQVLDGLIITNSKMDNMSVQYSQAQGWDISGSDMRDSALHGSNFTGSRMENTVLAFSQTENTILDDLEAPGLNLTKTMLTGSSIQRSNLDGATFDQSEMIDTDIRRSSMKNSSFRGVWVAGLQAEFTDLEGAVFTTAKEPGYAICNSATVMPTRFICKDLRFKFDTSDGNGETSDLPGGE